MRSFIILFGAFFLAAALFAGSGTDNDQTLPLNYAPSGKLMFKQYCASCHGADARGDGPLATFLKVPPADLTVLAKNNNGKFPRERVTSVLEFGSDTRLHGSSDMPVWGPIFQYYDKYNQRSVEQRVKNLCDYLASVQEN